MALQPWLLTRGPPFKYKVYHIKSKPKLKPNYNKNILLKIYFQEENSLILQPGAPFGVEISKDRQSLSLKLHPAIPMSGLGKQRFTYWVQVNSLPGKRDKGIVNIDARIYLRNQTVTSVCPHGRMWLPGMPIVARTAKRLVTEALQCSNFFERKFSMVF